MANKKSTIVIPKETFRDKVHACWIGKNIGGTMGAPYEGKAELLDISGFVTAKGEILPNDDLDLQLVWLSALDRCGPGGLTLSSIGEYWLSMIGPHWNEYGIGKTNLLRGILPPLSGEVDNEKWRTSNGAWIRTEIWASLFPGFPSLARQYAFIDASVDHGCSEGTYAALFVATLESCAYFESDVRRLIDEGLSAIPESCRVAKAVRLAVQCYDDGIDWKETREKLIADSADIGFFQAPANVAFVVLGLLYGGGDFKKSMILAIDCGDDTDCTGATVGSIMGIIGGTKAIPADWADHIGDAIETLCVNKPAIGENPLPLTCTELTEAVLNKAVVMFDYFGITLTYDDTPDAKPSLAISQHTQWHITMMLKPTDEYFKGLPYWYDGGNFTHTSVRVCFDRIPTVREGEDLHIELRLLNRMHPAEVLSFRVLGLPDSWEVKPYNRNLMFEYARYDHNEQAWTLDLHIGKIDAPVTRGVVEIISSAHVTPMYVPLVIPAR